MELVACMLLAMGDLPEGHFPEAEYGRLLQEFRFILLDDYPVSAQPSHQDPESREEFKHGHERLVDLR